MELSTQDYIFVMCFYGLGAAGLFAIGALPLRALDLLKRSRRLEHFWPFIALVAVSGLALIVSLQYVHHIGRCLLGFHCSANISGGWLSAVSLGVNYLAFELAVLAILWAAKRQATAA